MCGERERTKKLNVLVDVVIGRGTKTIIEKNKQGFVYKGKVRTKPP